MYALGLACPFLFVLILSSYTPFRFRRSRSAVPILSFLPTLIDHLLRRRFVQPPEETSRAARDPAYCGGGTMGNGEKGSSTMRLSLRKLLC